MDLEANSAHSVLERMLIDENAEPRDLRLSLLEDITDRFSPDNEIGRGGFAVVYKGMIGERMVAVKKLSRTHGSAHEDKFRKEIECLLMAKHKNIVRFLGYCVDTQGKVDSYEGKFIIADLRTWLLCFEYAPNGNLQNYISDAFGGLEWSLRFQIIKGICEGLNHLHMNSIIHGDLKPANILLVRHMVPKITDFGVSRFLIEKTHYTTTNVYGTPGYMAPEFYGGKVTFASDIYSLGVIIMEILTGIKGYHEDDNVIESWMNRLKGGTELEQVRACTKMGKECMELDPKKRPVACHIIDMLDKPGSADETIMSSSLVEPQASLMGEQSDQKGIGKLAESLSQEEFNEWPETEDDVERFVNDHSQKVLENTCHLSSWKSQDIDQKANHKGTNILCFNSSVWDKLNIFNIFRKDSPKYASSNVATMGNSSSYASVAAMRNSSSYASVAAVPRIEAEILESANVKAFTYNELRIATRNFRPESVVGEGGFGSVFKGWIDDKTLAQTKGMIAVKKLKQEGFQGHMEWLAEVKYLGQLSHLNLIKLIGYCVEDEERLLVYELMPRGSLENSLFRRNSGFLPLSWNLRMKIAHGVAKGLAFLHSDMAKVIHRNIKPSDILLDANYDAKLSGFSLARDSPTGDKSPVSTEVVGTLGYAAPEYVATGHLTTKCDVFSFGVVLLEMLSGRRAMDMNRQKDQHNLVEWARPYLMSKRRIVSVLDPRFGGQYSLARAQKAASLALQCLSVNPRDRPTMEQVVAVLEQLDDATEEGNSSPPPNLRES